jgi:glycosyltransferase involved in cell wall biosynthesis
VRVGIDATSWTNRRGFGRFTRNVVPRLVRIDSVTEYILYLDDSTYREAELPEEATSRQVRLSESPSRAAAAGSNRRIADLLRLTKAVRRDRLDAFLFPSVYTYFPVIGTPTVIGIHDTIVHEFPQLTLASRRDRLAWHAKEGFAIRTAASIFTVSEASRAALEARFGLGPERVHVVSEAPDEVFSPQPPSAVDAARRHIGLAPDEAYFVYAGGISPHKNVGTLVHAYAEIVRRRANVPRLVLVGDLTGDSFLSAAGAVRALVTTLGLEALVLLPGYVDDATLAAVYSGATAVVIPSLAEGFGLPAVEGAACGAPMVLSDLPAHRETLDGCAIFFPPTDADALADTLADVLDDGAQAAALAAAGRVRAGGLSWDVAAEALREVIAQAVEGRNGHR